MTTRKPRGKATPEEVAHADARKREEIEYEIALHDLTLRTREVARALAIVLAWCGGDTSIVLTDRELAALGEAANHYRRLAEKMKRRM